MKVGRILRVISLAWFLSGCISISTHEKLRKEYAASRETIDRLEAELANEQQANSQLRGDISEIRSTYDELVESLKDDIQTGSVELNNNDGRLTITMGNAVLFKSGSADLGLHGQKILAAISKSLRKVADNYIQVEGHTDNAPISGKLKARFATNWELSSARAVSVVRFLQEKGEVDPSLLVLSAFAQYRPQLTNASVQGREQNRRVEISLLPKKS